MTATMTRPGPLVRRDPQAAGAAISRRWLRWRPAALIAAGTALVPWLFVLAAQLPSTATARHWSAAWAGLDAMEAIGLLATGLMLARRDDRARLTAMAAATLLLADAWLDVMTATAGADELAAVTMAALCELPAAGACIAVALGRPRHWPARGRIPAGPACEGMERGPVMR